MADKGSSIASGPLHGDETLSRQPEDHPASPSDSLLQRLCVCPACRGELAWSGAAVDCPSCGSHFDREQGIVVFAGPGTSDPEGALKLKQGQAEFFDAQPPDWEIDRPHGAPALYGWLMTEKFQRSLRGLETLLPGSTVLTVCGGSGMDAEFLARAGVTVISSDLSVGAALRARARAKRYGIEIIPLVADAMALPFRTGSVDIAYVHDGLHHLSDPEAGLLEMVRAARCGISLTEPAEATATAIAVRLGLALEVEEAGNRVERFATEWVSNRLEEGGLHIVGADRYPMFYRHEPGPAMRLLSRRRLLPAARAAMVAATCMLGPFGNKLSVRAVRKVGSGVDT